MHAFYLLSSMVTKTLAYFVLHVNTTDKMIKIRDWASHTQYFGFHITKYFTGLCKG